MHSVLAVLSVPCHVAFGTETACSCHQSAPRAAPRALARLPPTCHSFHNTFACLACLAPPCRSQGVQFVRCLVWEVVRMHHLSSYLVPCIKRHLPVAGRGGGAGPPAQGMVEWWCGSAILLDLANQTGGVTNIAE
jgi:hypothetical protein